MKKYIYSLMVMLLALLSVGFTACSNDDEPKVPSIVGTWQHDHEAGNWDIYYQFTKDGKFHYVWKTNIVTPQGLKPTVAVANGTYTVSGTKLIVTLDSNPKTDLYLCPSECEYSVQGDKLKLLLGEDEPTFTRVKDNTIPTWVP
jgi:hypothetical protein